MKVWKTHLNFCFAFASFRFNVNVCSCRQLTSSLCIRTDHASYLWCWCSFFLYISTLTYQAWVSLYFAFLTFLCLTSNYSHLIAFTNKGPPLFPLFINPHSPINQLALSTVYPQGNLPYAIIKSPTVSYIPSPPIMSLASLVLFEMANVLDCWILLLLLPPNKHLKYMNGTQYYHKLSLKEVWETGPGKVKRNAENMMLS